ncbi:M6 family metalloprotease domain-containing protein [bacterium]|nr:M6 family metalloprotease domain-containing protein [bacterium]
MFKKPVYKLAVIPLEFPDLKLNEKIKPSDWEASLFSTKMFNDKNATGQKVYGSMNDFYIEQSDGSCKVDGKVFAAVTVEKKRMEYASGSPRTAILDQALTLVFARDGEKALEGYDGVFFLYAGSRAAITRGNILWPHKGFYSYKGKRITYFICPEGGEKMFSISVIAHEFGHMLGLPDLYARPEVPDMEGLGRWCSMSNGEGQDGRPVHFSAWCKEQMGWTVPTLIDPRVQQKLILSPIEGKNSECIKIPVRPDGTEYFLLENRVRKGFDQNLLGEGLLIWRVVDGKPNLEESHGIAGPAGPGRFPESVPYPSKSNRDFTPMTTPSSTPVKQGGWPLHITNIQRLPDGRVAFQIGYEFY